MFAPSLLALLVGASVAQDLSYDGSALWAHVTTGMPGAADRWGRVLSTLTIFVPLLVVMLVAAVALTGRWDLLGPVLGLTAAFLLGSLGVGAFVGGLWQWPAPPPGANPFQKGSSGGLPAFLSFGVTTLGTLVVGLPDRGPRRRLALPALAGLAVVPVGLATGALVLVLGVGRGGRLLERRWPEVLRRCRRAASDVPAEPVSRRAGGAGPARRRRPRPG